MVAEKISPGYHPSSDWAQAHLAEVATAFGIAAESGFEKRDSLKTTVFVATDSVLKIFPDSIRMEDIERSVTLSQLGRESLVGADLTAIDIPKYLTTDDGRTVAMIGPHPVVAMKRLPGSPPKSPTAEYFSVLALAHALIHRPFQEPRLIEGARRINCFQDYIDVYMRPGVVLPNIFRPTIERLDGNWQHLPAGVVHMDLWAGNTLAQEGKAGREELSAVIDWEDAALAPRILCLGMALWGIYVKTGGDPEAVTDYEDVYRENAELPLTDIEEESLRDAMAARAFASWYGAMLVDERAAANDMVLIEKLLGAPDRT